MSNCSCKHPNPSAGEPLEGIAEPARSHEPLLGVAEPAFEVSTCGPCVPGVGTPCAIRFERRTVKEGVTAFETLSETRLPKALVKSYDARDARHAAPCLPWVRVERDPERFRECLRQAAAIGEMTSPERVFRLLGGPDGYLTRQDQEVFLVILLDTQLQVRGVSEIVRGSRDGVDVPIPDVLRIVIVDGARSFIVVHNHPSGRNVKPSDADKELTKAIAAAAKTNGIPLMDHVIVGVDTFYSFAAHHLL